MAPTLNLNPSTPIELLKSGYFFKTSQDHLQDYIVIIENLKEGINCTVRIGEINKPQGELAKSIDVENGQHILVDEIFEEFTIDIWGKYYFPQFPSSRLQWYHSSGPKDNQIKAMAEVMEYALQLGLKIAKITPY